MAQQTSQELSVLLHLELQQSEQLKKQVRDEFGDIAGVLELYGEYKYQTRASDGLGLSFSQYVTSKQSGGTDMLSQEMKTLSHENSSDEHKHEGTGGRKRICEDVKPASVTPSLISTTALLAKLTQKDIH